MTSHRLTLHVPDSVDTASQASPPRVLSFQWDFLQFVEHHICGMLALCLFSWRCDSENLLEEKTPSLNLGVGRRPPWVVQVGSASSDRCPARKEAGAFEPDTEEAV